MQNRPAGGFAGGKAGGVGFVDFIALEFLSGGGGLHAVALGRSIKNGNRNAVKDILPVMPLVKLVKVVATH